MSKSLQDQLIQAGLVSTKQVNQAKAAKSKKRRQDRHPGLQTSEQIEIQSKAAEKVKRDLELNRKRDLEKQRREIQSQIKQLVDAHQIAEDNEGEAFHFNHNGLVKKVYVSDSVRLQITQGKLAIVLCKRRYRIVPPEIAEKISAKDESALVFLQNPKEMEKASDIDAEYAKYQIPDDLIW